MARTTRSRRFKQLRLLAVALLPLSLLAACGGDDDDPVAVDDAAEDVDANVDEGISNPQLGGLEVTVSGDVTEVLDSQAFQIDKDGLGEPSTGPADDDTAIDFEDDYFDDQYDLYDAYDGDYDYYDYGYYTEYDPEIDEFDDEGVLVVTPGNNQAAVGDGVQVNGTLRYFNETEMETLYDTDFDDDTYAPYEGQYVIIADSVKKLPATREEAKAGQGGGTPSTTTSPSTATTAPPG